MPKIHSAKYLDELASYVPEGRLTFIDHFLTPILNNAFCPGRPLNIIASIESARGLWDAGNIAAWSRTSRSGAGDKVIVSSLLVIVLYASAQMACELIATFSLLQKTVSMVISDPFRCL